MQTCYNCGKEVDDNVLICPECGALVKRYGKPERQPEQSAGFSAPQAYPGAYDTPAQPVRREAVWLDGAGRPHFKGSLCCWLILCAVYAGYMLLGFCSIQLIYHAQSFFFDTMQQLPEFSDMIELLQIMMQSVDAHPFFYTALLVLFALKLAGIVWFLISKRRTAFYCIAGVSVLLCGISLVFGAGVQAFLYACDCALTAVFLRKSWKKLKP